MKYSNHRESLINSKVSPKTLPFNSSLKKLTNNLNAIRSTPTKKSIDLDSNTKPSFDTNEHSSNLTLIEQKQIQLYVNNLINIESNHNTRKSIVKSSYQIPSPKILLLDEFSSPSKPSPSSNMMIIKPNSFHLRIHPTDNTEELISNSDKISTASINSLNLIYTSHHERFTLHKTSQNSISSVQQNISTKQSNIIPSRFVDKPILSNKSIPNSGISLSQMTNDLSINSTSILSHDLKSPSFKLLHHDENIQHELPTDTSPQIKIRHEIKPKSESLWKTKLTLKTLLSMANRDEAQALKNRKPIDYHMFLSNKFNKNSILQYDDHIDTKFTANNKQTIIEDFNEQDYNENRELYKRLLNTMGLHKPLNTKKNESMKQKKTKRRTKIESFSLSDDSINETEKPVLIIYQAIPI